ncbi:hypothetical protein NQ315_005957 [Exocentrus adspersus]|uniref:Reverse transcriptase n=1 Tax=Exocentrus adspersus TaxID=1586481 RepID=A0AAV8VB63_9CUCU|nr:hypothetical protein NQ315_005957 [Exocentrus adspersus]
MMPNIKGPGQFNKRKIWGGVVDSIVLYAAPIWAGAMKIERHRKRVERVQRKVALRIAKAYRTVSTEAAQVVAGIPIGNRKR